MAQRTKDVNEEIVINLPLKVTLKSFSNHNGFTQFQVQQAIAEFKHKIQAALAYELVKKDFQQEELLTSVDFVNFEVTPILTHPQKT